MTSCKRNTVRTPAWWESVWGWSKRVTHSLAFPTWDSLFLNWNRKDWMRETWDSQNIPKESFNSDSLFDFPWGTSGRSTLLTTLSKLWSIVYPTGKMNNMGICLFKSSIEGLYCICHTWLWEGVTAYGQLYAGGLKLLGFHSQTFTYWGRSSQLNLKLVDRLI